MKRTLLVVCLLTVGGCSSTSFVGKRLDNFTAYYNTFYNAKKAYDDAVRSMDQPDRPIDRDTYMLIFDPGNRGSGTRDFENAIKKSADVLRGHPNSKWVDDALVLIGKSYYHMGNTVGAQQKFREVIDRASSLEDEGRFWLGLALVAGGVLDEASTHLQESIEREGVARKWKARMQLVLGELYVRQERWAEAAEQLRAGSEDAKDDELAGRAQFLLGQVLETLADYDGAARAYRDVSRFKPRYELSYAAKFNAIRVEGEFADSEAALGDLRKMERDDKNFGYRAEIEYLRGRILQADQRSLDALEVFYDVLYDSDASIGNVRGPTHYHVGLLLRDQFIDFDLAAAHFDTAATALGRGGSRNVPGRGEALAEAPYAITDASELAEVFGNYADFHSEVLRYDSLLALGSLDPEAFRVRIEEIRRQLAESIVEERRDQARREAEAGFRGGGGEVGRGQRTGGGSQDYDTAGFLYHRDRSRVQDGLLAFFDRWGERPLVADWRRSAAIASAASAMQETGEEAEEETQVTMPATGDLTTEALLSSVEVDISGIPRTAESQAEMKRLRAAARYELANVLFLSIGLPDSAAAWYRRVLDEAEDTEIRARALYALAEVQQSVGDTRSSTAIYRQVLDEYPDSEVAARSAQRLGISQPDAALGEANRVRREYQAAFDLWVSGSFEDGMRDMLTLAASNPDTVASGRALLAASSIYVDWADTQGRDVIEPIGIPIADSLWIRLGLLDNPMAPKTTTADSVLQEPMPDALALPDSLQRLGGQRDTSDVFAIRPDTTAAADSGAVDRVIPEAIEGTADVPEGIPADTASISSEVLAMPEDVPEDAVAGAPGGTPADSIRSSETALQEAEAVNSGATEVYLVDIYRLIEDRYPGSTYAQRASTLAAVLDERLRQMQIPDSVATMDSLAVDSSRVAAGAPVPVDSARVMEDPSSVRPPISDTDSVRVDDLDPGERGEVDERPLLRDEDRLGIGPARRLQNPPDTVVYVEVDTPPVLVGGKGALQRTFRYPDTAAEGRVSGLVKVQFVVDQSGRVVDPEVVEGVGAGCDDEAERVVRLSRYRPATVEGRPVRHRLSVEIVCSPTTEP